VLKKIPLCPDSPALRRGRHWLGFVPPIFLLSLAAPGALVRTVFAQDVLWTQYLDTIGDDYGTAVSVDETGSIRVAGVLDERTHFEEDWSTAYLLLAQYDPGGTPRWEKRFYTGRGYSMEFGFVRIFGIESDGVGGSIAAVHGRPPQLPGQTLDPGADHWRHVACSTGAISVGRS
jgi:hypothetical protein